jgi:hypothetical protein
MNDSPGKPLPSRIVLLLLNIFIARGIILACVLPPFEGWDEYQHLGYIDYCAYHTEPAVYQQTQLASDFIRSVDQFPQPRDALSLQPGAVDYQQYWTAGTKSSRDYGPVRFYQSQHPFLYYRLMVPVYRLCGGRHNLRLAVSVMRLINLAFGAVGLWLVLNWIRRSLMLLPGMVAACCASFHPLLLLNLVRVANDGLAFVLGISIVVLCLALDRDNFKWRMIRVAIILPFAILAKATNLTLLPLMATACVIAPVPKWWRLTALVAILALFTAVTGPYFALNLYHFGVITPMQEAIVNHQAGRSLIAIITGPPLKSWAIWTWCLWVHNALWVGGWSFLQPPRLVVACYEIAMGLGLMCLFVEMFRRRIPIAVNQLILILLLLLFVHAGLMYHEVESFSARAGQASANPWYAAVAIPWWMILITVALVHSPLPRGGMIVAMSMPFLELTAEAFGTVFRMIPAYYSAPSPGDLPSRLSILHPAWLGFPILRIFTAVLAVLLTVFVINVFAIAIRENSEKMTT